MRSKGFTLIELALVLSIIAILVTLAVPATGAFLARSRAEEARSVLQSIAQSENAYHRDHGKYIACAPSADAVAAGVEGTFDGSRAGWKELGFALDGPVRYRYEVTLEGATFAVHATGDLDGDGKTSKWTLAGDTLSIDAQDELE